VATRDTGHKEGRDTGHKADTAGSGRGYWPQPWHFVSLALKEGSYSVLAAGFFLSSLIGVRGVS